MTEAKIMIEKIIVTAFCSHLNEWILILNLKFSQILERHIVNRNMKEYNIKGKKSVKINEFQN